MVLRDIRWSKKLYSFKEICKANLFPSIVKVAVGCSEERRDMEVSIDEVFRLHQKGKERRIYAIDSRHRQYNIPVHYGKQVRVISYAKKSKKTVDSTPMFLESILLDPKLKLPVVVEFVRMSALLEDPGAKPAIQGQFELQHLKFEEYILGNRISADSVDQDICILPVDIEAEVFIAEGLLNGTESDWLAVKSEYDTISERVNFDMVRGNKNIISIVSNPKRKADKHFKTWTGRRTANHKLPSSRRSESDIGDLYSFEMYPSRNRSSSTLPAMSTSFGIAPPPYSPHADRPCTYKQRVHIQPGGYPEIVENTLLPLDDNRRISKPNSTQQPLTKPIIPTDTKPRNAWQSLPDEIDDFSIADVCKSLYLLRMDSYQAIFMKNNIDGAKLKILDLTMMTKELKMRPMDALNLDTFITKGKPKEDG